MNEPVVVIGSGPSGAAAAHRLVERGIDVVMLDAGAAAPRGLIVRAAGNTLFRRMGWAYYESDRLAPESADAGVVWYSSRSNGGLSNFWTAAVPRFAPDDFTEGARLDERYRWPVTYEELVPFYECAERLLTVTAGPPISGVPDNVARFHNRLPEDWRTVVEHVQANGDGAGSLPMAKGKPWMVARRGTEFGSYHCVIQPMLAESPQAPARFGLHRNACVSRLVWSVERSRVVAVEYIDRASGETRTQPARAVVVAAGTIDSTMILLRSTSSDFPDGIGNAHDLVGRYLHDHPREWWAATLQRPMTALAHPVYLARRPFDSCEPLMGTSHTIGLAARAERLRTYYRGRTAAIGVQVFGTMVPRPDQRVTIDRGRGGDVVSQRPSVSLRYDDQVVRNMVAARERLRSVFGDAGLQIEIPGPFHDLEPGSSVHMTGTVRMHSDPTLGVVDRYNRIHDAPNVVVSDMSAFTTGPEKNPTLTAMALSIRAADRLADDLR